MVGAFADGGEVWQRLLVSLVHPLGAAGVLLLVLLPRLATKQILAIVALLTANVLADLRTAQWLATGVVRGDWELCGGVFGGSGPWDYLRAGAAPSGSLSGRVRLRPEPARRCGRARTVDSYPGYFLLSVTVERIGLWVRVGQLHEHPRAKAEPLGC